MTSTPSLDTITLDKGAHDNPRQGMCLMEAVAWWRGLDHTDRPACVSPVLGAYGRALNDRLPDQPRQQLIPLIPLLPGTAGDGHDRERAYMACDWAIRTALPEWLDLAGLASNAATLRALPPITNKAAAVEAWPICEKARTAALKARGESFQRTAAAYAAAYAAYAAYAAAAAAAYAAYAAAADAAAAADRRQIRQRAYEAAANALRPTAERMHTAGIDLYRRMILIGPGK